MPYARLRYRGRTDELVAPDTEIVIEGFPRSGNTFATMAFLMAQDRPVKIGHHTHAAGHVARAAKLAIPTLVVVREPVDSCASNMLRFDVSAKAAVDAWLRFHRVVADLVARVQVATFPSVTADFGEVTSRLNARFGTAFVAFDHTPENVERVFERIDERNRSHFGSVVASAVPRPSADRDAMKASTRAALEAPAVTPLVGDAVELYRSLVEEERRRSQA